MAVLTKKRVSFILDCLGIDSINTETETYSVVLKVMDIADYSKCLYLSFTFDSMEEMLYNVRKLAKNYRQSPEKISTNMNYAILEINGSFSMPDEFVNFYLNKRKVWPENKKFAFISKEYPF